MIFIRLKQKIIKLKKGFSFINQILIIIYFKFLNKLNYIYIY